LHQLRRRKDCGRLRVRALGLQMRNLGANRTAPLSGRSPRGRARVTVGNAAAEPVTGFSARLAKYILCMYTESRWQNVLRFDWDQGNTQHIASHRVTPGEVEQVFANDAMDIDYDVIGGEERWTVLPKPPQRMTIFIGLSSNSAQRETGLGP